jgi:hypothetical protein
VVVQRDDFVLVCVNFDCWELVMSKENKWGSVNEIDMRTKVGSAAWKAKHPRRVQHLSAFRRLHDLAPHEEVRHLADAPVSQKLKAIDKLEGKK